MESDPSRRSQLMLQGDIYTGTTGLSATAEPNSPAATCSGRWTLATPITPPTSRRISITPIGACPASTEASLNTIDVDAQHHWRAGRHNIVFGTGYRRYDGDDLAMAPVSFLIPASGRHTV